MNEFVNDIPIIDSYKYLGIEVNYKLSFSEFKLRILAKARVNMGRIWQMGIRSGFLSIKASLNIYQALVRSVLEYGSEVWGFDLWRDGEQVHWIWRNAFYAALV